MLNPNLPLEVNLDPSGWVTAAIHLPGALEAGNGKPMAFRLLEAHSELRGPVRFATGTTGHDTGYSLIAEMCLRGQTRRTPFDSILPALKSELASGLRIFSELGGSTSDSLPKAEQPAPLETAASRNRLEIVGEEIESHLRETEKDWSRRQGTCDFVINRDLDAYFQKVVIASDGDAVVFRSPLAEMADLREPCLTAVSNFLLKANGALRLARASVVSGVRAESGDGAAASIALEVVVPLHFWGVLPIDRIVGSLLVGARFVRQETLVLFDPGAAQLYSDIHRKEKQEHANCEYAYQHTAG